MDDFGFQPDRIDPAVQQARDAESLPILKAEREVIPTDKRLSIDREIVNRSKAAGVAYDFGFIPDSTIPASSPQAALAPGQAAGAPSNGSTTNPIPALNAAAYGAAQGVTAGTFDYLPAAMATGVSKLPGGSNLSFKETLAAVRARRAEQEAAYPGASTAGNVAGSIYTGARALPALVKNAAPRLAAYAAGVPALAAEQGAMSGTNTYASSPDATVNDAGKAAAIGAGTAGVLGFGANAIAKISNTVAGKQIVEKINSLLKDKPQGWKDTLEGIFGLGKNKENVQAAKDLTKSLSEGGQGSSIQTPAVRGAGNGGVNVGDVPELTGAAGSALKVPLSEHLGNIVSSTSTGLGTGLLAGGTTAGYNVITGKPVMDNVYQNVAGGTLAGLAGATAAAKSHILGDMTTRALTNQTVQKVAPNVLPTLLSAAQPGVQPLIDSTGDEKFDHSLFTPDKEEPIKYDTKVDPKETKVLGKVNPYAGKSAEEVNAMFGGDQKKYLRAWKQDKSLRDWELEREISDRKSQLAQ